MSRVVVDTSSFVVCRYCRQWAHCRPTLSITFVFSSYGGWRRQACGIVVATPPELMNIHDDEDAHLPAHICYGVTAKAIVLYRILRSGLQP